MASSVRCAPLLGLRAGSDALAQNPQFLELVDICTGLTLKVLGSIADTHASCVHTETFQLDSPENAKLMKMAESIGLPPAPVLSVLADNFMLEMSLTTMVDGLQLHRSLLNAVFPRLGEKEKVTELLADLKDLLTHISKMLKMAQGEPTPAPTPASVDLRLPSEYEVQVATHLTLVQLRSFAKDVVRSLRGMDKSDKDETEGTK